MFLITAQKYNNDPALERRRIVYVANGRIAWRVEMNCGWREKTQAIETLSILSLSVAAGA